jgi:hypothetical protein
MGIRESDAKQIAAPARSALVAAMEGGNADFERNKNLPPSMAVGTQRREGKISVVPFTGIGSIIFRFMLAYFSRRLCIFCRIF